MTGSNCARSCFCFLDRDNEGEFLNYHVLRWLQKRPRPVFMTRSRPYKKDDNADVEQKNWTDIARCGYNHCAVRTKLRTD